MATTYEYLTAEDWGRTFIHGPPTERFPDPEVYAHHTAGPARLNWSGADVIRWMQRKDHDRGYATVQYDFVIHWNEPNDIVSIMEGRGLYRSAATKNRNEEGEAGCLVGNYHPSYTVYPPRIPNEQQIYGFALGVVWGIERGWITSDPWIGGHRDNRAFEDGQPTACPGDSFYIRLPDVREYVRVLTSPPPTPPTTTPKGATDMVLIAKFGGTPEANWGGWFSYDGGLTRHPVRTNHHAKQLVALGAIDAVTLGRVTDQDWRGVSHTTSVPELNRWLGGRG